MEEWHRIVVDEIKGWPGSFTRIERRGRSLDTRWAAPTPPPRLARYSTGITATALQRTNQKKALAGSVSPFYLTLRRFSDLRAVSEYRAFAESLKPALKFSVGAVESGHAP